MSRGVVKRRPECSNEGGGDGGTLNLRYHFDFKIGNQELRATGARQAAPQLRHLNIHRRQGHGMVLEANAPIPDRLKCLR